MTFEILILGSNSASFAFNRHHTAQVVNVNQNLFLVDCGEGTQIQLAKKKVRFSRINHIFISHLHGDHYLGLIGLLLSMHLQGREEAIELFGPRGLDEILILQLKLSDTQLNYEINFHEIAEGSNGIIFENEDIWVETLAMDHRIPCSGFIFKEKPKKRRLIRNQLPGWFNAEQLRSLKEGKNISTESGEVIDSNQYTLPPKKSRTYAYCADTRYNEAIIPSIENSDLLYHEATFLDDMESRASLTFHSTARQAGILAKKAGVKKLLVGHFSSRYRELDKTLEEAKTEFENTELALEGKIFQIIEEEDEIENSIAIPATQTSN